KGSRWAVPWDPRSSGSSPRAPRPGGGNRDRLRGAWLSSVLIGGADGARPHHTAPRPQRPPYAHVPLGVVIEPWGFSSGWPIQATGDTADGDQREHPHFAAQSDLIPILSPESHPGARESPSRRPPERG